MTIEESQHGSVTALTVVGRIDTTTAPHVEQSLGRAFDSGTRDLVVDLGRVDYISSAGLRVFLVLAKRMRERQGRLVLCSLTEPVRQVFDLAGFLPLFSVEPSRAAALARLGATV